MLCRSNPIDKTQPKPSSDTDEDSDSDDDNPLEALADIDPALLVSVENLIKVRRSWFDRIMDHVACKASWTMWHARLVTHAHPTVPLCATYAWAPTS